MKASLRRCYHTREHGESPLRHGGHTEYGEFTEIIDGFGPSGTRARPRGIAFTTRYDRDADNKGGDSG